MKFKVILVVALLLIASVGWGAADWYVRPSGGSYGDEDGTSYTNAWDGFSNITWGSGGVVAGDTLWVCGTFVNQLAPGVDGSSGNPITINGLCNGEKATLNPSSNGYTVNGVRIASPRQYITVKNIKVSGQAWIPLKIKPTLTTCMLRAIPRGKSGKNNR